MTLNTEGKTIIHFLYYILTNLAFQMYCILLAFNIISVLWDNFTREKTTKTIYLCSSKGKYLTSILHELLKMCGASHMFRPLEFNTTRISNLSSPPPNISSALWWIEERFNRRCLANSRSDIKTVIVKNLKSRTFIGQW